MYQGLAYDLELTLKTVEEDGLFEKCTVTFLRRANDPNDPPVGPTGQPDLFNFTAISGLQNLPAMFSVWRAKPDMAAVSRLEERFDTLQERHLLLDGYFPGIHQRDVVDITVHGGTFRYEIMSVEHDSQSIMTRCAVRIFTL
jgi:hypothetical protein